MGLELKHQYGDQLQGNGGTVAEVDGTNFRAQRVSARPLDHGALGAYSVGLVTGVIPAALTTNSEIYQFRWADATRLCVIRRIRIGAAVSTTMFAAGVPMQLDLARASAWTVAGSGGTRITMSTNSRRRTSMGSSLVTANDIGIATTAALTVGTKTLDGLSLTQQVAACPTTGSLNGTIWPPGTSLWTADVGDSDHPLVLAQNEGFVIRCAAVPGVGTWQLSCNVDWAEVTAY